MSHNLVLGVMGTKQQKKYTAIFLVHMLTERWSVMALDNRYWTRCCFHSCIFIWELAGGFRNGNNERNRNTDENNIPGFWTPSSQAQLPHYVNSLEQRLSRHTQLKTLPRDGTWKQVLVLFVGCGGTGQCQHCSREGLKCLWGELQIRGAWTGFAEKSEGGSGNKKPQ